MKNTLIFLFGVACSIFVQGQTDETITISGKVTDFEGKVIDSCVVQVLHSDFSSAYEVYSDKDGNYKIYNVKKGKYLALYAIRPKEYPRRNAVPDIDKRLEYWAWNLIADRDLVINPRYHRLELYGLTAFKVQGEPGLMVYVRPMSLGKLLQYSNDIYTNKERIDNEVDISVSPENFRAIAFIDNEPVKILSIQPIKEYTGKEKEPMIGYIMCLEINKRPDRPYIEIKIEGTNLEFNERGENVCFYEIENYK
ncbi:MAG TPA: carboxypeptidase regulatory-like domain-containing protein [Spirochaetia bacterium]|nr:carboxypeptidase regulatory-like domain-containing protein [Spirochaetia bacterium]